MFSLCGCLKVCVIQLPLYLHLSLRDQLRSQSFRRNSSRHKPSLDPSHLLWSRDIPVWRMPGRAFFNIRGVRGGASFLCRRQTAVSPSRAGELVSGQFLALTAFVGGGGEEETSAGGWVRNRRLFPAAWSCFN